MTMAFGLHNPRFMGRFLPIVITIVLMLALSAYAQAENAPSLTGWTHGGLDQASDTKPGIVLPGNNVQYSSAVVAEVDGDTSNGPETVVASAGGTVSVVRSNGELLWSATTPISSCKGLSSGNKIYSSAAVGALKGDNVPYVVIGYGGIGGRACDGGVVAFHGPTGAQSWKFSLKDFSKKNHFWAMSHAVFSTPALADTDNDGKMEIGFGSFDRNVYLLNFDGSVRWYYNAADTIWSSAVFANVDSDPNLEMIIGTDISRNDKIKPKTMNGGFVYAFKTSRRKNKHINFRDPTAYVWQTYLDQVVYSAPVVADVLDSSPGKEVIVGSGCFFPQNSSNKGGKWIKILRQSDGKVVQTLNTTACLTSSPAVGDIEGTGHLAIVATVNGSKSIGGDGLSRLTAWRPENPEPIWSVIPRERGHNDAFGGNFQSAVLADLDGNGSVEVIVANSSAVGIFNGADGTPLTCQTSDCTGASGYTLFASKVLKSTPTIADVDGDGELDVVIGGGLGRKAALFGWTGFKNFLGSYAGSLTPYTAPWPMYRGNAQRSGYNP